jgi:hypothetical protein
VLAFGEDQDVFFTHVEDQGLLLNSTRKLYFRDSGMLIHSDSASQLDIDATGEVEIAAPIVDINATNYVGISNDLKLDSDASIISFGADNEVKLTHIHNTGLLLTQEGIGTAPYIQFRDALLKIGSSADGQLDIDADAEIELTSATVHMVATTLDIDTTNIDIDSTLTYHLDTATAQLTGTTSVSLISDAARLVLDATDDEVTVNSLRIDDLNPDSFVMCDVTGEDKDIMTHANFTTQQNGAGFTFPGINYNTGGNTVMNIGGAEINLNAGNIDINSPYAFVGTPFQAPFETFLIRYQLNAAGGNKDQHMAGGRDDYIQNYTWVGGYELQTARYLFQG